MFELCPYSTDLFINKKNQSTIESSIKILRASLEIIKSIPQWNQDAIFSAFENFSLSKNTKMGYIMWPLRISLSGQIVTPGGAMDIMSVIGREETMVRLSYAIELLETAQKPVGTGSKENYRAL
jgi:glutamyl-tRNA synthetase